MTPEQNQRAYHAQQRALALSVMVRDEHPDSVAAWLGSLSERDKIDLLIVLGAAMPRTTKQFEQAWAWTDGFDPTFTEFEDAVTAARAKGFRDCDIARALSCRVEDLPPRMKVA